MYVLYIFGNLWICICPPTWYNPGLVILHIWNKIAFFFVLMKFLQKWEQKFKKTILAVFDVLKIMAIGIIYWQLLMEHTNCTVFLQSKMKVFLQVQNVKVQTIQRFRSLNSVALLTRLKLMWKSRSRLKNWDKMTEFLALVSKPEIRWKNSHARLEARDWKKEILDLVSKHEIERKKISISSRSMRLEERNSRSRLGHEIERQIFSIPSRKLKQGSRWTLVGTKPQLLPCF